jgi:hypothetical protein
VPNLGLTDPEFIGRQNEPHRIDIPQNLKKHYGFKPVAVCGITVCFGAG